MKLPAITLLSLSLLTGCATETRSAYHCPMLLPDALVAQAERRVAATQVVEATELTRVCQARSINGCLVPGVDGHTIYVLDGANLLEVRQHELCHLVRQELLGLDRAADRAHVGWLAQAGRYSPR